MNVGDNGRAIAVRAHNMALLEWEQWLRTGGAERLRALDAFFARERCLHTLRIFRATGGRSGVPVRRYETRYTPNGTPYRLFIGWA